MKLQTIVEADKTEHPYEIFVDLDGVLADLETYVENVLNQKLQTLPNGNWANDDEIWKKLRELGEPKFDQLGLIPDAMTLWNYVKPHTPHVLTATGYPVKENAALKRKWVNKNLSGYGDIHTVEKSVLKADLAHPHAILIDDRNKSIDPWRKAGGIGIHHKSATQTIEELKKLGI